MLIRDTLPFVAFHFTFTTSYREDYNAAMTSLLSSPPLIAKFPDNTTEAAQVDWLINAFSMCFHDKNTVLARATQQSNFEPEYFPADTETNTPAKIYFAHGFFSSALHECSHWCIAGKHRRTLPDFGYWYAPDGRNAKQQAQFEQVEIKPQAIEWLFTVACNRRFRVSLDNLNGDAGNGEGFKDAVYQQVHRYLADTSTLPPDAARWFYFLQAALRPQNPVRSEEFQRSFL